eukprot:gene22692-63576_t
MDAAARTVAALPYSAPDGAGVMRLRPHHLGVTLFCGCRHTTSVLFCGCGHTTSVFWAWRVDELRGATAPPPPPPPAPAQAQAPATVAAVTADDGIPSPGRGACRGEAWDDDGNLVTFFGHRGRPSKRWCAPIAGAAIVARAVHRAAFSAAPSALTAARRRPRRGRGTEQHHMCGGGVGAPAEQRPQG